jgi:tetratricopeptide (TPR) repeat protein
VPRWRSSWIAATRGESASVQDNTFLPLPHHLSVFGEKLRDWNGRRGISVAADLLSTAFLIGDLEPARDAAQFLVEQGNAVPPGAAALARHILGGDPPPERHVEIVGLLERDAAYERIRRLKRLLRTGPRNALAWADLSLEYAQLAQTHQAISAMELALNLAPQSRFLLRSGARLFIHTEDPDRALDLLRRAPHVSQDPWLMAAEIAVSGVVRRSPRTIRQARGLLGRGIAPPRHVAELTSALGTLEASAGDTRTARKLFRQSLIDPTENVVAQAEWASQQLRLVKLEPQHLQVKGSFEARARESLNVGRFEEGLDAAWEWLGDQSFSRDAATFGSYLCSVALRDHERAIEIIRAAQIANPSDWLLSCNLVFALASSNRLDEAERVFRQVPANPEERGGVAVWHANNGLLKFRRGAAEEGRAQYKTAIQLLKKEGLATSAAVAAIYRAREELLAGETAAKEAVGEAIKLAAKASSAEIRAWIVDLQRALETRTAPPE